MKITPLQYLLFTKFKPIKQLRKAVPVGRVTYWAWRCGRGFPNRLNANKLIEFYGPENLDYNGCYVPSVELTEEQERLFVSPDFDE